MVGHFPDKKGHFLQPSHFTRHYAAMTSDDFIAAAVFLWVDRAGGITPFFWMDATSFRIAAPFRTWSGPWRVSARPSICTLNLPDGVSAIGKLIVDIDIALVIALMGADGVALGVGQELDAENTLT